MILKMLTHERNEHIDEWTWHDHIETVTVYYDERIGESVISVKPYKATEAINLILKDVAYICNDEGKTIEVLRGKREASQVNPTRKLEKALTSN